MNKSTTGLTSGLNLHIFRTWNQLELKLINEIKEFHSDPMQLESIVVSSPGHRRQISQRIASELGVCAGFELISWTGLHNKLAEVDSTVADPWSADLLPALVLAACDQVVRATPDGFLARFLGNDRQHPGRRGSFAFDTARLFSRYLDFQPQMLSCWASGENTVCPGGQSVRKEQLWQPELFRQMLLLAKKNYQHSEDPLTRSNNLLNKIHHGADFGLGERLFLISLDRPKQVYLDIVNALSAHIQVNLYLVNQVANPAHPMISHMGMLRQQICQDWLELAETANNFSLIIEDLPKTSGTLLGQIQHGLRTGVQKPASGLDSSLQIHAAHGIDRQVEVAREQICLLFAADPTLQPRDVVIVCPDPSQYAPQIRANFISDTEHSDQHPGYRLRAQLASSSVLEVNPVGQMLLTAVNFESQRATSIDLLDFCSSLPVATKFGLNEDNLSRLAELIDESGIRWGLDFNSRKAVDVESGQSTWLAGLDRIIAGFALSPATLAALDTALPISSVQSTDGPLIGALAEIISRIRRYFYQSRTQATVSTWADRWLSLVEGLAELPDDSRWMYDQLRSQLVSLLESTKPLTNLVEASDAVEFLSSLIRPIPNRANFGTGSMMICSFADLACIDHRVVVFLGVDESHFPSHSKILANDLFNDHGLDKHVWSRRPTDRREANQQGFIDAFLAATDTVLVVTQGANPRNNLVLPASVLIQELLQAANVSDDPGWPETRPASKKKTLVTLHTLQPFDPANFIAGTSSPSFDRASYAGAKALLEPIERPVDSLPPWQSNFHGKNQTGKQVTLTDLITFYLNPARACFKQVKGITLFQPPQLRTELPVELDGLQQWQISQRIASSLIAGEPIDKVTQAELVKGDLPPGNLGRIYLERAEHTATKVAKTCCELFTDTPDLVSGKLWLDDWIISGSVALNDNKIIDYTTGGLTVSKLIGSWINLLFAVALGENNLQAVVVTKKDVHWISSPNATQAKNILADMVRMRESGLSKVLPLPPKTSAAKMNVLVPYIPWRDRRTKDPVEVSWQSECTAEWSYFYPEPKELFQGEPEPTDPKIVSDPNIPSLAPSRFDLLSQWFWQEISNRLTVAKIRGK